MFVMRYGMDNVSIIVFPTFTETILLGGVSAATILALVVAQDQTTH